MFNKMSHIILSHGGDTLKLTKQFNSLVMLPPVTDPFAFVKEFVGLTEIKDRSISSSLATTWITWNILKITLVTFHVNFRD